jgi:hypothetical protein
MKIPRERRQTCKVCRCSDKFDFHVSDEAWRNVVPEDYRNGVVCLSCFDRFAHEAGVTYHGEVDRLYFAGDAATLVFKKD